MRSKSCIYCEKRFDEGEFPQIFDRMVTCGSVECMGRRRKERWDKRRKAKRSDLIFM